MSQLTLTVAIKTLQHYNICVILPNLVAFGAH